VFEAHRLVYHSTLGLRVIKKKRPAETPRWFIAPTLPPCLKAHLPRRRNVSLPPEGKVVRLIHDRH